MIPSHMHGIQTTRLAVALQASTLLVMLFTSCTTIHESSNGSKIGATGWVDDPEVRIDIAAAVERLNKHWAGEGQLALQVMHIPLTTDFISDVSSGKMDGFHDFRMVFLYAQHSYVTKELITEINRLTIAPRNKKSDLRWGCAFFTRQNECIFAVYFDRTGRAGVLNGACVGFDSDNLLKWAEKNFANSFR